MKIDEIETKVGTKYRVIRGGKMSPDAEPWESKWKKGDVWEVGHSPHVGLKLIKRKKNGGSTHMIGAMELIVNGVADGKLEIVK